MEKPLNKTEIFVCEMLWGGVPVDVAWVRLSKLFIDGMERYKNGEWDDVIDYLKK